MTAINLRTPPRPVTSPLPDVDVDIHVVKVTVSTGSPTHRTPQPARSPHLTGRGRLGDDGFAAVELVILLPAFVLVLLLVVGLGRVQQAEIQVTGAARDAARAASLTRTPAAAVGAARAGVDVALAAQDLTCSGGPDVVVDTAGFAPGGRVQVQVSCSVRLGDLGFPGLPATKNVTAGSTSPVETFRQDR
jgi:Flp pilus assembly protein TadG